MPVAQKRNLKPPSQPDTSSCMTQGHERHLRCAEMSPLKLFTFVPLWIDGATVRLDAERSSAAMGEGFSCRRCGS
ncbi:hypothetical protein SRHO_G00214710 [Serrasalmus rhombeus]